MATPEPRSWTIDGLELAGLEWGNPGDLPVLALHGWMDHAGSFAELAPRLTGCHVVALDLSGQGLSGHRAPHATYNIWDDLPQIVGLLDQLGWDRCVLLGHSRGANIGSLLAAAQPIRVRALIALDALVPEPNADGAAATLRAFLDQTRRQQAKPPRNFASLTAFIDRRMQQGNDANVAKALADRALVPSGDGYDLRGDPRLFASSAIKLSRSDIEGILRAIACPVLNIWAEDGLLSRRPQAAVVAELGAACVADYERIDLPGDHHFHMDPTHAKTIAEKVVAFFARHGTAMPMPGNMS